MFVRTLILIMLAAGCDANLKVATSGLGGDCVKTPHDAACQPSVEGFKAEKADFDGTAETLTVAWNNSSYLESATVILATQKDCTGQAAVFDQASGDSVSVSQLPDGLYYVCVSSEKNGQHYEAMNNGTLTITIDRHAPVIEPMADIITNTQCCWLQAFMTSRR